MDAQTDGNLKEKRPYQKQAEGIVAYLFREFSDHLAEGSSLEMAKAVCTRYVEIQLDHQHQVPEDEAKRLAHQRADEDLSRILY
jgi:hypothetical protein